MISYNNRQVTPELISAIENADTPKLTLSYEGVTFFVEFHNRTDYFSSRHGETAEVYVVSKSRAKIVKGTATNRIIEP